MYDFAGSSFLISTLFAALVATLISCSSCMFEIFGSVNFNRQDGSSKRLGRKEVNVTKK